MWGLPLLFMKEPHMGKRRKDVIDESEPGIYHCSNRVVRRARLHGQDPVTGKNFNHRKTIIERSMEALASVFAVECLETSVLDNHLHQALRNRPDLVKTWTDEEVARRWLRLSAQELELADEPSEQAVAM